MLRIVNRVVVGVIGLVLLVLGLGALVGGFDLPYRWGFSMPSWWPWRVGGDAVLSEQDRTRWTGEGWWWPVVFAVLALLVVLSLWWLLAQLRQHRLKEVLVETPGAEGETGPAAERSAALLRGRALERVLAADAEELPGVDRARAVLLGKRRRPRVRVGLTLAAHAEPGPEMVRLRTGALTRARTSAGLEELPAEVRLRSSKHRAERVS
ncbi:alkaline shock response membrane anchor protein AmaP [Streptomyces xiaopingdaonensis]|uniref:alkaline shock response membrane anchor protein AmaP n=1 Tax=Streptomyces xiaopingdaonensis TaxID=1565415 RepID=UPI0002DAA42A|nr:alkaline shock response membrane anchor protein AmaP [Streptomyces xiaopingdaonensis]